MPWTREDEAYMRLALEEAKKAWRLSPPNPSVGAVIVKDGVILGRGHTQKAGGPHAEIMAIRDAQERGNSIAGATVYVTLEPCAHYGRTPPCANRLADEKVGRVVAAVGDPNPKVSGRGIGILREAGIKAELGCLEEEAREVNIGFLTRMTRGTPWVRMKVAETMDGRTAFPDGRSQWITGAAAREDGHRWRGRAGAVVTGAGTVLADDPQMNVRLPDQVRQPMRVVIDSELKTPVGAKVVASEGGKTLIVASAAATQECEAALVAAGAEIVRLPSEENPSRVDLKRLLLELAAREVNEVHLEAGHGLNGAFLNADLVDEMLVYIAPCIFGSGLGPADAVLPASPGEAHRWRVTGLSSVGDDVRLICRRN